jgi:hypothetical protein
MKPLVWVNDDGPQLVCHGRFYIKIWNKCCELYQSKGGNDSWVFMYTTVDEAKAAAEKLALEEALRWVEEVTPEAPRWIPVGERMPPEDPYYQNRSAKVLVHLSTGTVWVSWFFRPTEAWVGIDYSKERVTHWMPLPQPPNGGA